MRPVRRERVERVCATRINCEFASLPGRSFEKSEVGRGEELAVGVCHKFKVKIIACCAPFSIVL